MIKKSYWVNSSQCAEKDFNAYCDYLFRNYVIKSYCWGCELGDKTKGNRLSINFNNKMLGYIDYLDDRCMVVTDSNSL